MHVTKIQPSKIFIYFFILFIQYFQRVALLAIQPVYQVALYNTIKHIHKTQLFVQKNDSFLFVIKTLAGWF